MHIVKILGMILLGVYLFFSGLFDFTSMSVPHLAVTLLGLVGMAAGILILISIGKGEKHS